MLVSSRTGGLSVEFESFDDGSSEKREASLEALVMSLGQESRERRFATLGLRYYRDSIEAIYRRSLVRYLSGSHVGMTHGLCSMSAMIIEATASALGFA